MKQLEEIGRLIKDRRDEEITKAVEKVSLEILGSLSEGFDPREVAMRISDEVGKILDKARHEAIT